jgi:hypothetical protein
MHSGFSSVSRWLAVLDGGNAIIAAIRFRLAEDRVDG